MIYRRLYTRHEHDTKQQLPSYLAIGKGGMKRLWQYSHTVLTNSAHGSLYRSPVTRHVSNLMEANVRDRWRS